MRLETAVLVVVEVPDGTPLDALQGQRERLLAVVAREFMDAHTIRTLERRGAVGGRDHWIES